jgi:hypothetical protein
VATRRVRRQLSVHWSTSGLQSFGGENWERLLSLLFVGFLPTQNRYIFSLTLLFRKDKKLTFSNVFLRNSVTHHTKIATLFFLHYFWLDNVNSLIKRYLTMFFNSPTTNNCMTMFLFYSSSNFVSTPPKSQFTLLVLLQQFNISLFYVLKKIFLNFYFVVRMNTLRLITSGLHKFINSNYLFLTPY